MRLAAFKMWLFVFFAGRLLKWAGRIEQETGDEPARPVTAGDTDNAVLLAEYSRASGDVAGLPEHWVRLVAKGPPQAWLDLIREKAPHLLPSLWQETSSTIEPGLQTGDPERPAHDWSSDDSTSEQVERSRPPIELPNQPRRTEYLGKTSGAKWLNRLRFFAPRPAIEKATEDAFKRRRRKSDLSDPVDPDRRTEKKDESSPDGYQSRRREGPDRRHASTPRPTIALRKSPAGPLPYVSDEQPRDRRRVTTDYPRSSNVKKPGVGESFISPATKRSSFAGFERTRPEYNARPAASAKPSLEWVKTELARARSNVATYLSESLRPVSSTPSRSPTVRKGSAGEAAHSEPSLTVGLPPAREVAHSEPSLTVGLPPASEDLTNQRRLPTWAARSANRTNYAEPRPRQPWESPESPDRSQVAGDTDQRDVQLEFASTDPEVNFMGAPVRSRWPTLPPAPAFDIADELVAREGEAESLRQLEQEQRGIRWNA